MKAPCLRCGQLQKMMEGMDEAMQGSAAERDALIAENARLALHVKHIGNDALRKENAELRAQLAEIAATEPVAWIDEYGNAYPLAARQYSIVGKGWKPLFTRSMPAQDVTELVDALGSIEWTEYNDPDYGTQIFCPECRAEKKHGHCDGCKVGAALSKHKGAE